MEIMGNEAKKIENSHEKWYYIKSYVYVR